MVIIKRYPNRKLYNTEEKQYITLKGIADLIREGEEIQVIDHASGEDLTALTLTQIILDQEKDRSGLLSNSILTGLIRAGGDRLNAIQRSLASSVNVWHQIDEEIRMRVQSLAHQGELSASEAENLIDKLVRVRRREDQASQASNIDEQALEKYLVNRQIPTHDDLQQLYQQLDELASKLEDIP